MSSREKQQEVSTELHALAVRWSERSKGDREMGEDMERLAEDLRAESRRIASSVSLPAAR